MESTAVAMPSARVWFVWMELAYLAPYSHGFDETFSDPWVQKINDALAQVCVLLLVAISAAIVTTALKK